MDKEKLLKKIPFLIMIISVGFVMYSVSVLQGVENQCNEHLKGQKEILTNRSCDICMNRIIILPYDSDLDTPNWVS